MDIKQKTINGRGIKLFAKSDNKEIARAYLYILKNDQRAEPFGFMEDVWVDESYRGQGLATELINKLIAAAKENKCYKIVGTSRFPRENVHRFYEKFGFIKFGFEFKIYLAEKD